MSASLKRPLLPPGYARRLGYQKAKAHSSVVWASTFVVQERTIGGVIEIYDDLAWAPFRTTPERKAQYYRGYAAAIGAELGCQVHLVFVQGRGNGHNDYRIVAGREPKPKRRGTPYQRRLDGIHRRQKIRKAFWLYRQFERVRSLLSGKVPRSHIRTALKKLIAVMDYKKRRYHPGWSAEKVAKTEKEKWTLLTSAS